MKKPVIGVTTSFEDRAHLENQMVNPFYLEGVRKGGGEDRVLDFLAPLDALPEIVAGLDGLLLIGGGDVDPPLYDAEREPECGEPCLVKDNFEIAIFREARRQGKPVLGICRGIQVINVAMGGTLVQDVPKEYGVLHQQTKGLVFWHDVSVVPGTRLAEFVGGSVLMTNSYHHQCIRDLAPGLVPTAWSQEGFIEAVEGEGVIATQWHPERTVPYDRVSLCFFQELVRMAGGTPGALPLDLA